jgi:hypothetical protein
MVIAIAAAGQSLRWRELLGLVVTLSILMVGVFHYGLDLPIPVWPRW